MIPVDFHHIDFQPPFTADRYIEAFQSFEHAGGFGVVIIDSYSHVWEGEGGALDQAETSNGIGLAKWASPKIQLKRLTNVMLRAPMHVIFCMRHKLTKGQDKKGPNGRARIFDAGFAPIAEKNTLYEMGVSLWIGMDHKPIFRQPSETVFCRDDVPMVKAPQTIMQQLVEGEYLSAQHGKIIARWYAGETRDLEDDARRVAERGTESLKAWFSSLKPEEKRQIKSSIDGGLKAVAAKADADEAERISTIEREKAEMEKGHVHDADADAEAGGNRFLDEYAAAENHHIAKTESQGHDSNNGQPDQAATVPSKNSQTQAAHAVSKPDDSRNVTEQTGDELEQYRKRLKAHDWYYQFSDDGRVYRDGQTEHSQLVAMSKKSPEFKRAFDLAFEQASGKMQPKHEPEPPPIATKAPAVAKMATNPPTTEDNPF